MIDIRIMDTMATDFAVCQIGFKNTVDAEIDDKDNVSQRPRYEYTLRVAQLSLMPAREWLARSEAY